MAAYSHFTVTAQQVSIPVNAGETFSISVTVTNDEEASNNVVDSLSLTLDAGHSASATLFGLAPNTKGTYQWTVEAFTLTVEVHPTPIYGGRNYHGDYRSGRSCNSSYRRHRSANCQEKKVNSEFFHFISLLFFIVLFKGSY